MSTIVIEKKTTATKHARVNYLYGPIADFLLLGGGSVAALTAVALLWPKHSDTAFISTLMLYLANIVNHPHFAHSYQLFYRNFRDRAFGNTFPPSLRARYLFAAVAAPVLLAAFFTYCVATSNVKLLGFGANLMFFLVGWHYVKQGYGMLMVDAVLKRNFFANHEKQILLWNSYVVWMTSWVQANNIFHTKNFWGIGYYALPFPSVLLYALYGLLAATTLLALRVLAQKWRANNNHMRPANGAAAYLVSLYVWLLTWNPAMLLVIPAFHSLQYLAIVWKYRIRMEKADIAQNPNVPFASRGAVFRFGIFLVAGFILGYLGFWAIPEGLDATLGYNHSVFGGSLFLFIFWTFINVHHYFLDNVMWRKDNPDTRKYLFGT